MRGKQPPQQIPFSEIVAAKIEFIWKLQIARTNSLRQTDVCHRNTGKKNV